MSESGGRAVGDRELVGDTCSRDSEEPYWRPSHAWLENLQRGGRGM